MGIERDQRMKNYPDIALVAGTLPKQTREPRRVRGQAHRVGAFNGGTATTLTAGEGPRALTGAGKPLGSPGGGGHGLRRTMIGSAQQPSLHMAIWGSDAGQDFRRRRAIAG